MLGMRVGVAVLELDRAGETSNQAALERNVNKLRNLSRRQLLEAALAQDRGLERELGRDAGAHLLLGRHLPGLVVEDGVAAIRALLDPVGAGAQRERALAQPDRDLA